MLRASYVSGDGKIMGTIGVINLSTTNEAHYAGKVVGQNDFIAPLSTTKGVASKLGKGTGIVEAEYKGHYLILTWAEFVNGTRPRQQRRTDQLEQFGADLVAGTANISLSQRMVNGATPRHGRQLAAGVLGDAHPPGERGARRQLTAAPGSAPPPGRARAAATTRTAGSRTAAASTCDGHDGGRLPSPTASSAPTSARTMLWQNASATTQPTATPVVVPLPVEAAQRAHRRRALPAAAERGEVVLARVSAPAAAFIAARSSAAGCHSVSCLRSGSAAAGSSQTRYE